MRTLNATLLAASVFLCHVFVLVLDTQGAIVFSNLNEPYGQGGFEQVTSGQQVGASILNGSAAVTLSSARLGGTLELVGNEYFSIYSRISDGSFNDGLLGDLLFTTTAGTYVENKPADAFNPARGTTTFLIDGAFTLQANTAYWFVLGRNSLTYDPVQWAYTYNTAFASDTGAQFPSPSDYVTYFAGPSPDPTDSSNYFPLSDGPQLLELTNSPVPEPTSLVLFAGGALLGLVSHQRSRRLRRDTRSN